MQQSVIKRFEAIANRHKEVETLMSQPDVSKNPSALQKLGREYRTLNRIITLWSEVEATTKEIQTLKDIITLETDKELVNLAKSEIDTLNTVIETLSNDLKIALLPKDETETADAIVEIRAGAGGNEAGLFAAQLFRMYERYAETQGWNFKVANVNETGIGGLKEVVFEVTGDTAYKKLKLESGVHRVQRVPTTESQGRIHTSTATVAVLPKSEDMDIQINENDLNIEVFHSGGPGGQNVNKLATAIRITHKPSRLVVQCQNERSQIQNRLRAMDILKARLWDMELKKRNEEISAVRKSQVGTGDRSEKIRTYNFPQSRITDHRINYTNHQLTKVMDGDLGEFVDTLLQEQQARLLASSENIF